MDSGYLRWYNHYIYDSQDKLVRINVDSETDGNISYSYDNYDRLAGVTYSFGDFSYNVGYSFKDKTLNSSYTTGYVEKLKSTVGSSVTEYTYTYDANGNITKVAYRTGEEIRYIYDDIGQLVHETNELLGITCVYFYDNAGNITGISTYALDEYGDDTQEILGEKNYDYSTSAWGDLLTSFNGHEITYDEIGNPLSYYNGVSYNFSWIGRRLTVATKNGRNYFFTYNDEGLRTSKTKNGVTTTYYLNGSRIVAEETSGNLTVYIYDASGSPIGMQYRGANYSAGAWDIYWYEKNLQGDIVAVYEESGVKVATYVYDAWGNHETYYHHGGQVLSVVKNPFRYRGYYYDIDLGLYYLNSRYYDSVVGRFINADNQLSVGSDLTGTNLFAYCGNNPVNRIDPNGYAWKDIGNWFSNCWNNVKITTQKIVDTVKENVYTAYYNATKWHFEEREANNGIHPTYSEVNDRNSGWSLLPESQSIYHDNGVGKSELKYITDDGREAVFDGDTLEPVTDPRYIATYNYSPLYQMPSTGAGVLDYVQLVSSGVGHFFADMLPYYLTGNSNTREQFESKIFFFS